MSGVHLCVASHKQCWQGPEGEWHSYGGFPLQMEALGSTVDRMTLVITRGEPRAGGIPLPRFARVVPLRPPAGRDARRKLSVLAGLPYYLATLRAAFREADAVHVPLPGDIPLLGLLVAAAMRKPILARYGGTWQADEETTLMNRVTQAAMRRLTGGRNVMLATGDGALPPAPGIEWIFSTALWERDLASIVPAAHGVLHDPPALVYAGRLSPEKGVDVLIEAVADLAVRRGVPVVLTIAGDGPERERLRQLAGSRGVEALVRFAGQLDRAALGHCLAVSDLCVQPSRTEGFSKAWLDAMAYGLPVLASRVGAAASVVGEAEERGWLVPPGDAGALADRLQAVLTHPRDWTALRRRCRSFVEGRTLDVWATRIATRCEDAWGRPLRTGAAPPQLAVAR